MFEWFTGAFQSIGGMFESLGISAVNPWLALGAGGCRFANYHSPAEQAEIQDRRLGGDGLFARRPIAAIDAASNSKT